MPTYRSKAEREAVTRAVLEASAELSHQALATKTGLHRDAVRQIRYGLINADILPDLPRLERGSLTRTCMECTHFTPAEVCRHIEGGAGTCDLGIPESEQLTYARACSAFWPAAAKATHAAVKP